MAANKRAAILPNLPTMAEAGMSDFDTGIWFCLLAPKGTPQPIIEKLAGGAQHAMGEADVIDGLGKQGIDPLAGGPDALARFMRSELARWSEVARAAGLKS